MLDNKRLDTLHASRFATILSRLATVSIILGLVLLAIPLLQTFVILLYFIFIIMALILYGAITLFSVFTLLLTDEWQAIGGFIVELFTAVDGANVFMEIALKLCPYFLIVGFIAMAISLIIFIITKKDARSQKGIKYTSIFLGVSLGIVLITLLCLMFLAMQGGAWYE